MFFCVCQYVKNFLQRYSYKLTLQNPLNINKLRKPPHYTTPQQKTLTI